MNRRLMLTLGCLGLLLAAVSTLTSCSARQETATSTKRAIDSRPAWLHNTPLVMVANHDSMPIFQRRRGGSPVGQEAEYVKEDSEEAIRKLKDIGVTLVVLHFYKGFGLEAEKDHMEKARQTAAIVHRYGMRVGVYVGSTIAYETFLAEKPQAEKWFVPDFLGRPVFYDDQPFRKRVYFMHPEYREYMKRVLTIAEKDFHADLIHFDNTSMQAEPPIFQHPMAIEDFRKFLQAKYSPEQLKQRFGFSEVRYILPPQYDRPLGAINDPLFQEWADFRCVQLTAYYAELEELLRTLNPEVAVETNPHSGISGRNTIWEQGVDYPRLLAHMDAVWTEEGDPAGVTEDGILVNKIRTFKMASMLKNTLFVANGGKGGNTLMLAESMAFNRQCLGDVGGTLAGYDLPRDQQDYIDFYRRNFEHYKDVDNIADVAVLHSYASMGFNNDRPAVSTMLFEQALIQANVPFDLIFDDNLKNLSKYRVLVLADQECLNDEKMDLIRKFVDQGGGLVATELSTLFTEWRLRRPTFGLQELFHAEAPRSGRRGQVSLTATPPIRNQAGKGRVVYISEVKPSIPKPPAVRMTSQYWKLPDNAKELVDSVQWAAGARMSLEVKAPPTVVAELMDHKPAGELLVHLVNYGRAKTPSLSNIEVSVRIPQGKKASKVMVLSPDGGDDRQVNFAAKEDRIAFTVPRLQTYTLALVTLAPE